MANRKRNARTPTADTLSPADASTSAQAFPPRSKSPQSGGLSNLFRPTQWFNRTPSAGRVAQVSQEPRASTSSAGSRKHKISKPTDPRPILSSLQSDSYVMGVPGSRSVLDLSLAGQHSHSFDTGPHPPSHPNSPVSPRSTRSAATGAGLGDLRSISRKPWSRSADDLGKYTSTSEPATSPLSIDTKFQQKVVQYRKASISGAADDRESPRSPKGQAFPSSKSPVRSQTQPVVSSGTLLSPSSSSPISEGGDSQSPPNRVHVRSNSFTPRLPSKLATGKLGNLIPPSPRRKMSGASEERERAREESAGSSASSSGSRTHPPFPFSLAMSNSTSSTQGKSSAPSPVEPPLRPVHMQFNPPMIVEPPDAAHDSDSDEQAPDGKRTSEIVYQSGFINRLPSFQPAPVYHEQHPPFVSAGAVAGFLAKGWKPYKVVLKGSKLYFYKPPSDKAAAVKELFVEGVVPMIEEEEEGESQSADKDKLDATGSDGGVTLGRRKRAYWGRKTHPDLTRSDDGRIEKGTLEALVHEAVFGTTFLPVPEAPEERTEEISDSDYRAFASAIILILPSIVGQAKFEVELLRCCDYFISGADESEKQAAKDRVQWLSGRYLEDHGKPADPLSWEEWRKTTLPESSPLDPSTGYPSNGENPDAGGEGSGTDSDSDSDLDDVVSPNLGTFSPRPVESDRMVSLVEILKAGPPAENKPPPSKPRPTQVSTSDSIGKSSGDGRRGRSAWNLLERDGLTREVLLMLDPHTVSTSLKAFHRNLLLEIPPGITLDSVLAADGAGKYHPGVATAHDGDGAIAVKSVAAFCGTSDRPQWLTRLVVEQVLGTEGAAGTNRGPDGGNRPSQTSRTHKRSEVISAWALIGEVCRLSGDGCSWNAIQSALTSRPVARLSKAWKRVDEQARAVVESWVHIRNHSETVAVKEPIATPWASDIPVRLKGLMESARSDDPDAAFAVSPLQEATKIFEELRHHFDHCRQNIAQEDDTDQTGNTSKLVRCWRQIFTGEGESTPRVTRTWRIDQFMSLSLAAEPRHKGLYEPCFWTRATSTSQSHPLLPLLFPEPLPIVHLIDREILFRTRTDSTSVPLDVQDFPLLGSSSGSASHIHRRSMDAPGLAPRSSVAGLDLGGTVISLFDNELVLVVQAGPDPVSPSRASSRPASRPSSRPPSSVIEGGTADKLLARGSSIRVKTRTSQGLDRKPSLARRSSLPSLSSRLPTITAEVSTESSERPLTVLVKAGTLDRLVTILIHGLEGVSLSVADDIGETPLRDGKSRELRVDRDEFSGTWWNVFRSFVTPLVFFELLQKRYTALSSSTQQDDEAYLRSIRRRSNVLHVVEEWITRGGGAQDVLDDDSLFTAMRSFLASRADEATTSETEHSEAVLEQLEQLKRTKHDIMETFVAQTRRPSPAPRMASGQPNHVRSDSHNYGRDVPNLDNLDAEELVNNLDAMAAAAFRIVSEEDLFVTADILEVQTADRTAWFMPYEPNTFTEDIDVQTIHAHLSSVEPSPMISESGEETLHRVLPPGIRSCVRAHIILRKWLIALIAEPGVGLGRRQARMELLLRALEICRLRDASQPASSSSSIDRPVVRSFVEAVLASAILSPESRAHHRAWQNVAAARCVSNDSLASLLSNTAVKTTSSPNGLTMDIGWLLESMLEIISTPDVVDGAPESSRSLVNYEKRRYLSSLITNVTARVGKINARDLERLNAIEKEVRAVDFDQKAIREEAYREAAQASAGPRRSQRPFQKIVVAQQEKYKRDKYLRDRLLKEKKLEQSRTHKREDQLSRAMQPRRNMSDAQKQHRNKKSVSSAFNFLQFMRPISSAFSLDTVSAPGPKRTAAELDFTPTHKPALVLTVADAKVAKFINNERSFTFQLDTEDGGHYLLQAISRREMNSWIANIGRMSKIAAKRRLTWLGDSPRPQLADHLSSLIVQPPQGPRAVFGVDLASLLRREAPNGEPQPGAIPFVLERCLSEVESRGLSEVGIYRIAGGVSDVNGLREAFNRGETPVDGSTDIYAVCDLVKSWFRVLPEPVFPSDSYFAVIDAGQMVDPEQRVTTLRKIVHGLPRYNFDLLKRISQHLYEVTEFESQNQMTARSLAIVFMPNLLRDPKNEFATLMQNMGSGQRVTETLIDHFHRIFDETDDDAIHDEEEWEAPIPEEDEEDEEDDDTRLIPEADVTMEPQEMADDDAPSPPVPA